MTHRSFAYESGGGATNERLEFLGDAVLGMVITESIYQQHPDLDESGLSPLRSGIVNMRALAQVARNLNLGAHIKIGKGEEITGGRDKNSILADAFEALIGAIYLDKGYEITSEVILRLITDVMAEALSHGAGLDGKTALQELVAAAGWAPPEYQVTESGPDHDKDFIAVLVINGKRTSQGSGKSKREAEQNAARLAYQELSAR